MAERANILYILTDQQAASALSCAGNTDLHTPAMDSLAAAGVRFERAYCSQPLCIPSRSTMITGLMPHETNIYHRTPADTLPDELQDRELGTVFAAAGYECVYGGKWHLPGRTIPDGHGFRKISDMGDDQLAERCVEFLRQPHERPFLLVASFHNPHDICQWARNQPLPEGPIPAAALEECPTLPANFPIPPFEPEVVRLISQANPHLYLAARYSPEEWRQYRHAYYRLVEKVDAAIGRILAALREEGLEEDTVVIFSSDHGDGMGAHQWSLKSALYEEPTRVPLIVSFEGRARSGCVDTAHLVSNGLDLLPTLCDYAGIAPPAGLRGRSFRPLVESAEAPAWRDHLVVETSWRGAGPGKEVVQTAGRMLRTARYKYVVYNWGRYREQLFDLEADPGEMVNLAVSARHRDVLDRHRKLLHDWCRENDDPFGAPRAHRGRSAIPGYEYAAADDGA